jgi:YVTN family beta-propeller protein
MKRPQLRIPLIAAALGTAVTTAATATPALTPLASVPETAAAPMPRWTFDGAIHNNSLAVSPDETIAVASYSERPDVIVYDLRTGAYRAVLHGYITPRNIVFEPSGHSFYISDSSLGRIDRVDSRSLQVLSNLSTGAGAFGTTISADGGTLYVNNEAVSTVTRFDLTHERADAVITGFAQPRQGVRLSPDGATLFVTNFLGDKITLVDTRRNTISGEIAGFNKIRAISISADGKTLYAANSGSNSVSVVDVGQHRIVMSIPVGRDPYGAALSPDGKTVYSGNLADNSLSVIDVATQRVVNTITGFDEPRQAIVFNHAGSVAYVLNKDLSVSKVDLVAGRITETLRPE